MLGGRASVALAALLAASLSAAVASGAPASYRSPRLTVTQGETVGPAGPAPTSISLTTSAADDPTAQVELVVPTAPVSLAQPPGTTLGSATATIVAGALGDALLLLSGQVETRDAGGVYELDGQTLSLAEAAERCTGTQTHAADWVVTLRAAGETLEVPLFVDRPGGSAPAGGVRITWCLPSPELPASQGGAPLGAKIVATRLTLPRVFPPAAGVWYALFTPYAPGTATASQAGSVYSPASVRFASLTVQARARRTATRVSGRLTQGSVGVGGARVEVWAGVHAGALRRIARLRTDASGAYALVTGRKLVAFQARATLPGRSAPTLCRRASPFPAPCVNPTLSGFSTRSPVVRAR